MTESVKTAVLVGAALVLGISAAVIEPEARVPAILSDQGAAFYPNFTDPQSPRTIEVVDYDEATATAIPLKVQFQQGKWVIASHYNYRVDIGDRLSKTAAALMYLKKDMVRSDSALDHAKFGVVDPLDEKASGLTGRGKRVTLRDANGVVLADYIFGKPAEGKPGYRYVRVPGQKRTYAVKTDADPSARFADWVNAGLLRISSGTIRKVTINRYNIDPTGHMNDAETAVLTQDKGEWNATGEKLNLSAVHAMAAALDGLKIVDVRPKPPGLAAGLRHEELQLTLETALSLQKAGYFFTPQGRVYSSEGDMTVGTNNGLMYSLRFGEVAAGDGKSGVPADNRTLFVMVHFDAAKAAAYGGDAGAGERAARELNDRFADWYYVISGRDFQNLRLGRGASKPAVQSPGQQAMPPVNPQATPAAPQ
ncbi:MAG TPA: DUF4340 domain-containing protein [Bryobacteraceae bacterium]|jgi:hypothetical protein|nr:DUF4340 domain-containing protein [Bryobacteraceae bacterium]